MQQHTTSSTQAYSVLDPTQKTQRRGVRGDVARFCASLVCATKGAERGIAEQGHGADTQKRLRRSRFWARLMPSVRL